MITQRSGKVAMVGVDIGASHLTAAQVRPETLSVLADNRIRKQVNSRGSADEILHTWISSLSEVRQRIKQEDLRLCLAVPGPFDYENGVCHIAGLNKYDSLFGLDIRTQLAEGLDIAPASIFFRNDAEAFLHGEVTAAGLQHETFIGVTLGAGLGSAVFKDGKSCDASRAFRPMRKGIAEDYISTRWFGKQCAEITGGQVQSVDELIKLADHNLCQALFQEFGANLGVFINDFQSEENAQYLMLGGDITRHLERFMLQVILHLDKRRLKILRSSHWEDAALLGACVNFLNAAEN